MNLLPKILTHFCKLLAHSSKPFRKIGDHMFHRTRQALIDAGLDRATKHESQRYHR